MALDEVFVNQVAYLKWKGNRVGYILFQPASTRHKARREIGKGDADVQSSTSSVISLDYSTWDSAGLSNSSDDVPSGLRYDFAGPTLTV